MDKNEYGLDEESGNGPKHPHLHVASFDGADSDDDDYQIQPPCWLGQQLLGLLFSTIFGFTWRLVMCSSSASAACYSPGVAIGAAMGVTAAVSSADQRMPLCKSILVLAVVAYLSALLSSFFTKGLDPGLSLLITGAAASGGAVAAYAFRAQACGGLLLPSSAPSHRGFGAAGGFFASPPISPSRRAGGHGDCRRG
uniref:Uncharacterized protein n=1 Tax=Heterosigma akashiwo TaxID=2829 RepID=A0A6S9HZY2_HETAK|mmetsp:Transcript_20682/g.34352  ORF Transcript_20682/g.34352 Transcript_20682/m.34352 type:complete len:196 (+) Transcript_20682:12-599(+)